MAGSFANFKKKEKKIQSWPPRRSHPDRQKMPPHPLLTSARPERSRHAFFESVAKGRLAASMSPFTLLAFKRSISARVEPRFSRRRLVRGSTWRSVVLATDRKRKSFEPEMCPP